MFPLWGWGLPGCRRRSPRPGRVCALSGWTARRPGAATSPPRRRAVGGPPASRPRLVAGLTRDCLDAAMRFLGPITDAFVPVGSIHTAELVKVFENTFRLVNISLVNELAALYRASQVDFDEVLDAAGTKPYGFVRHRPSPGAGGDCIPVAAGFFAAAARRHGVAATVVETAIALNQAMPAATL